MSGGGPEEAAAAFLLTARDRRGRWRDFRTLAGASDEWVTAYVGCALADLPDPACRAAARAAWIALRRGRWLSAGFGYTAWVPADADSTAWALRLADALGDRSRAVARARRFLARHQAPDGLLCTFGQASPIRRYIRVGRHVSFAGWCGGHVCVTAAAGGLLADLGAALGRRQQPDGSWSGYWWCDREYTTALACEAILREPQADPAPVLRACAWLRDRIDAEGRVATPSNPGGSAFATAWAIRGLALAPLAHGAQPALRRGMRWLAAAQRADGSWPPSAALRIPAPCVVDPDRQAQWRAGGRGAGSILLDLNGVFTTATVVSALQRAGRVLPGPDRAA